MEIKKVTVVGANGTMGRNIAAIFASFGNAQVYLVSRSIEKSKAAKDKACLSVRAESIKEKMIPSDYEHLDVCIKESDLIFEACAEDLSVKEDIHHRIAEIIERFNQIKIVCTGTSGLSVTKLAEVYPEQFRHLFIGMHLFNPPYHMTLCEMIPTKYIECNPKMFRNLVEYTRRILRRTVVETMDTPAFLGNRIGFQFINEILIKAEKYKYNGGIDYMDAIIGSFTGRSMPPLVTTNFVGLDVHKAIVDNIYINTNDYAHDTFVIPEFVTKLINEGKIGKKTGAGLYCTKLGGNGEKKHQVYDIEHGIYRDQIKYTFPFAEEMIHHLHYGDYRAAFKILVENQSFEARLCCELLLKYIIYSLNTVNNLGCGARAADDVMATGFHWCPPLALAEAFSEVVNLKTLCNERIDEKLLNVMDINKLLDNIEKSAYDYRKYILAKR